MELNKIYWKDAIDLIKNKQAIQQEQINFNNEMIPIGYVIIFNENGYRVPQESIEYDDDNLDYSDIPAITEEDIKSGKLERVYTAEIPVKEEMVLWLKQSNINFNDLIIDLVNGFYQTMKHIQKNAAL